MQKGGGRQSECLLSTGTSPVTISLRFETGPISPIGFLHFDIPLQTMEIGPRAGLCLNWSFIKMSKEKEREREREKKEREHGYNDSRDVMGNAEEKGGTREEMKIKKQVVRWW